MPSTSAYSSCSSLRTVSSPEPSMPKFLAMETATTISATRLISTEPEPSIQKAQPAPVAERTQRAVAPIAQLRTTTPTPCTMMVRVNTAWMAVRTALLAISQLERQMMTEHAFMPMATAKSVMAKAVSPFKMPTEMAFVTETKLQDARTKRHATTTPTPRMKARASTPPQGRSVIASSTSTMTASATSSDVPFRWRATTIQMRQC